ncbi:hypothetical protein [Tateyamaria omphalii]|uniref:Uncharacterized protein n=1 Tax=Tateyamaria omphalii TaxID=299262 RepID=A0A1P8MWS5_9RHOB|nr:hypothetical protein [Tateyamaria omphalii]APX12453.1 hypothetical protein BWR18_12765 [Tateyamaria omphalii]
MHKAQAIPVLAGAGMGTMMLSMLHRQIMSGNAEALAPILLFVGLHILAVVGLVLLPLVASAKLRARLQRLHRPDARHLLLMLLGAIPSAGVLHLYLHGLGH